MGTDDIHQTYSCTPVSVTEDDPTWAAEYVYFKSLCHAGQPADLSADLWLNHTLRRLGDDALSMVAS
jgi:hypothetical protein